MHMPRIWTIFVRVFLYTQGSFSQLPGMINFFPDMFIIKHGFVKFVGFLKIRLFPVPGQKPLKVPRAVWGATSPLKRRHDGGDLH